MGGSMKKHQQPKASRPKPKNRRPTKRNAPRNLRAQIPNPVAISKVHQMLDAVEAHLTQTEGMEGISPLGIGVVSSLIIGLGTGGADITLEPEGFEPVVVRPIDMQTVSMQRFAMWAGQLAPPPPTSGISITQPVGHCDGSRNYAYDPSKDNCRGRRLEKRCPGCRACQ
jgi:hypothetical protein